MLRWECMHYMFSLLYLVWTYAVHMSLHNRLFYMMQLYEWTNREEYSSGTRNCPEWLKIEISSIEANGVAWIISYHWSSNNKECMQIKETYNWGSFCGRTKKSLLFTTDMVITLPTLQCPIPFNFFQTCNLFKAPLLSLSPLLNGGKWLTHDSHFLTSKWPCPPMLKQGPVIIFLQTPMFFNARF